MIFYYKNDKIKYNCNLWVVNIKMYEIYKMIKWYYKWNQLNNWNKKIKSWYCCGILLWKGYKSKEDSVEFWLKFQK